MNFVMSFTIAGDFLRAISRIRSYTVLGMHLNLPLLNCAHTYILREH